MLASASTPFSLMARYMARLETGMTPFCQAKPSMIMLA
ncbi:MAG: hypothetical protein K0R83_1402 [Caulobacter sp.]|nr:hypothetical protein [Caulobacter sp.]